MYFDLYYRIELKSNLLWSRMTSSKYLTDSNHTNER